MIRIKALTPFCPKFYQLTPDDKGELNFSPYSESPHWQSALEIHLSLNNLRVEYYSLP